MGTAAKPIPILLARQRALPLDLLLDLSVMQTIVSKIILFFVRGMRGIFVSRRELSNKVTWGCWGLKMEERVS